MTSKESPGPLFDYVPSREEAEGKRELGMARVRAGSRKRDPAWEAQALENVREYAKTHEHFAIEDVRAAFGTPEGINPKAYGPVVKRAHKDGICEPDGFVIVNCSNRSPRVKWKSLVYRP